MNFIKYDELGRILFSGDVPESMLELQGENVLPITGSSDTHYVDINSKKLVRKSPKPADYYTYDYQQKMWVDARDPVTEWIFIRKKRDELLTESDWTQLPDVPTNTKELWSSYRQQLRNITTQNVFNIVWPIKPNS